MLDLPPPPLPNPWARVMDQRCAWEPELRILRTGKVPSPPPPDAGKRTAQQALLSMMILLSLGTFLLLPAVAAFSAFLCLAGVLRFGLPLWLGRVAARRWQVLPPMLVESEGLSIFQEGIWQLVRWTDVASVRRNFFPDRFVFRGRDGTTLFEIDSAVPYMEQMAMALIAAARDGNVPEQGIHDGVSLGAHDAWMLLILPGCMLIAFARVWATLSGERASPFVLVASALLGALLVATPWLVHRRHARVVLRPFKVRAARAARGSNPS